MFHFYFVLFVFLVVRTADIAYDTGVFDQGENRGFVQEDRGGKLGVVDLGGEKCTFLTTVGVLLGWCLRKTAPKFPRPTYESVIVASK